MAKMLIQSESLTAIADEIRVLSGTEDAMSLNAMKSNLGDANTDVGVEAELIAQIQNALEGKVSGSVKETTTVNFECSGAIRVYYVNADGELVALNAPNGVYDNIPVNQMLAINNLGEFFGTHEHSGDVELVCYTGSLVLLHLYGECTLIYSAVTSGGSSD